MDYLSVNLPFVNGCHMKHVDCLCFCRLFLFVLYIFVIKYMCLYFFSEIDLNENHRK